MVACDYCATDFAAGTFGGKKKRFCSVDCKNDYQSNIVRKMMSEIIKSDAGKVKGMEADFIPRRLVIARDDSGATRQIAISRNWIGTVTERQLDKRAKRLLKEKLKNEN